MDYSKEEIAYVDYCVKNLPDCQDRRRKCPVYDSCHEDGECQQLCNRIIEKMNSGEILWEEDRKIIEFFTIARGLWEPDDSERACYAKDAAEPCPNLEFCTEREQREGTEAKWVCSELVQRLDTEAQKVKEKDIQKVILRSFPNDWKLEEKLVLVGHERSIPEVNGRIDILVKGETTTDLYIVELKSRATREHVGQLASYVGWCKKHPLSEQTKAVKGILLAEEFDKGALSALEVCPDLRARICKLRVDIENVQ